MSPLKLINLWQTPEERRGKYWLCRALGANPSWARSMRDWRLTKIERKYGIPQTQWALDELERLA